MVSVRGVVWVGIGDFTSLGFGMVISDIDSVNCVANDDMAVYPGSADWPILIPRAIWSLAMRFCINSGDCWSTIAIPSADRYSWG